MKKSLHSPEYEALTLWLRDQRVSQGISMRELANKLGVAHSLIGKIEQRERRLDVIEYIEYCSALGISPERGLKMVYSNSKQ